MEEKKLKNEEEKIMEEKRIVEELNAVNNYVNERANHHVYNLKDLVSIDLKRALDSIASTFIKEFKKLNDEVLKLKSEISFLNDKIEEKDEKIDELSDIISKKVTGNE